MARSSLTDWSTRLRRNFNIPETNRRVVDQSAISELLCFVFHRSVFCREKEIRAPGERGGAQVLLLSSVVTRFGLLAPGGGGYTGHARYRQFRRRCSDLRCPRPVPASPAWGRFFFFFTFPPAASRPWSAFQSVIWTLLAAVLSFLSCAKYARVSCSRALLREGESCVASERKRVKKDQNQKVTEERRGLIGRGAKLGLEFGVQNPE